MDKDDGAWGPVAAGAKVKAGPEGGAKAAGLRREPVVSACARNADRRNRTDGACPALSAHARGAERP